MSVKVIVHLLRRYTPGIDERFDVKLVEYDETFQEKSLGFLHERLLNVPFNDYAAIVGIAFFLSYFFQFLHCCVQRSTGPMVEQRQPVEQPVVDLHDGDVRFQSGEEIFESIAGSFSVFSENAYLVLPVPFYFPAAMHTPQQRTEGLVVGERGDLFAAEKRSDVPSQYPLMDDRIRQCAPVSVVKTGNDSSVLVQLNEGRLLDRCALVLHVQGSGFILQ
jgi:hypothetical protein